MTLQKPTIATVYSGNCEFMNAGNSLLLDFTIGHIQPEDCFSYFDPTMQWAYPSPADLEQKLLFVYHMRGSRQIGQMTRNAARDIKKFAQHAESVPIPMHIIHIVL